MLRFTCLVLLALLVAISPALAYDDAPVITTPPPPPSAASDRNAAAIDKDTAAVERHRVLLARDQVMRDENRAKGNWFGRVVNSVSIGYDHMMIGEKKAEKAIDEEIMNHDTK